MGASADLVFRRFAELFDCFDLTGQGGKMVAVKSDASGLEAIDAPAGFDPASPGAIGGTTPAAGTFTGIDLTSTAGGASFRYASSSNTYSLGCSAAFGVPLRLEGGPGGGVQIGSGGGLVGMHINGDGVYMREQFRLIWGANDGFGNFGTADLFLGRDAAGVLAQRNGTEAQSVRIYRSFINSTNYARGAVNTAGGWLTFQPEQAGTESWTGMRIGNADTTPLLEIFGQVIKFCGQFSVERWRIDASGHFIAGADNTYDIGASGANRPRHLYVAGEVYAGANISAFTSVYIGQNNLWSQGAGILTLWNNSGNDFNRLQFGGTSASFPAIKRTGSDIEVLKADGTAVDTAVILSSPDGTRYRVTVANGGAVTTTAL